jgi:hypothetical protein
MRVARTRPESPALIRRRVPPDGSSASRDSSPREPPGDAFGSAHPQGATTNAQALADDVPLQVDAACCFDYEAKTARRPG